MTTDELITALREYANADEMPLWLVRNAMTEAADRLEEQDRIIQQYKQADVFLATHGWIWRDDE